MQWEGLVTTWMRKKLHDQKLVLKMSEVIELSERDSLLHVSSWIRTMSRRCVV